ncbi:hypothetical protein [Micromonospora aurantiaca (nom. illeg.)]|uniref:hypothetical protein n=1 Tax=Micromonospora aurantiaca (nom. illeg.) TaxID=47850 RepID=UPI0033D8CBFE
MTTPPARQRDVQSALSDPARTERSKADHTEGLRKLATAAEVAVGRGATREEILAVVTRAADELAGTSSLAATARARVHDGDDTY